MRKQSRHFYICLAVLILTVISAITLAPVTTLAYWDNLGGRPALTLTGGDENGDGATFLDEEGNPRSFIGDYTPVFNSIVNNPNYGDERNFISALSTEQDVHTDIWKAGALTVEDGKTYFVRMYIHNNNPNGEAATATGTKVAFSIPEVSGTQIEVGGWINSDNANATQIYDDVVFQSSNDQPFHLEYVYGSAILWNNGFAGASGTAIMDDAVVTGQVQDVKTGALIGYEGFDGKIPGCFEYDQIVSIQVKVVYDYEFDVDVKVRPAGTEDEFTEVIDADIGDQVEYQIEFHNTSTITLENVMLRDVLPENMVYVVDTTYLYNSNHEDGKLLPDDGDIFNDGSNIGNYLPGASGWVRFNAEIKDKSLTDGDNTLVNWAQIKVSSVIHQDHTKIIVQKPEPAKIIIRIIVCGAIILCLIDIVRLRCKLRRLRQ